MQPYDLIMLVVLGSATLFGFWKGLAWQIASLASLVVSYFVALRFADRIAPMVSAHEPWNKFLAMLIIYAAASLVIWMLFRVVSGVIDRVKLN
jgi:membrane protein required for colicin V production